jgi:hypothetical protein
VQQILSVASRALRCTFPKRNCKKYGYRSCKPVIDLARVGVATSEKHLLPVGIEPGMFCSADALSNLCHVGTGKNGIVNVVLMFCPNDQWCVPPFQQEFCHPCRDESLNEESVNVLLRQSHRSYTRNTIHTPMRQAFATSSTMIPIFSDQNWMYGTIKQRRGSPGRCYPGQMATTAELC